jgi:hypothetical protein
MAVPDDVTLSPAFAAVASTGLDATSLVAVGGGPPRVPRLEVPIDVQALRVAHGDTVEHADVATTAILDAATRPLDETDPDAVHAPPPFTELDAREPGVYVHWAMPDALLRADVVTEDVSDVQPDGDAVFPPLPNRWCLTRFWWHKTGYTTRSWVVEADRGRVTALEDWEEVETLPEDATAATPEVAPGDLTAVLGGDAAWFAVYDNVVHRFALYDDLADLVSEPPSVVHYTVVGWYSDAAHDPIAGTARIGGFDERLAELAWTADTSSLQATTTTFDRLEVQTNDLAAVAVPRDGVQRGRRRGRVGPEAVRRRRRGRARRHHQRRAVVADGRVARGGGGGRTRAAAQRAAVRADRRARDARRATTAGD